MSTKPDHRAAREWALGQLEMKDHIIVGLNFNLVNLIECYLDLVKQHGELVKCVEFYGDKKNYTQISPDYGYSIVKISSDDIEEGWSESIGFTTKTGGKLARETLARIGVVGDER